MWHIQKKLIFEIFICSYEYIYTYIFYLFVYFWLVSPSDWTLNGAQRCQGSLPPWHGKDRFPVFEKSRLSKGRRGNSNILNRILQLLNRRNVAEIQSIWSKTLINQFSAIKITRTSRSFRCRFSHLLWHTRGHRESILTRILTGHNLWENAETIFRFLHPISHHLMRFLLRFLMRL
jgi:hypothetical protein